MSDPTREALREAGAWIAALGTDEASIVAANIEALLAALPTTPAPRLAQREVYTKAISRRSVPGVPSLRDALDRAALEGAPLAALPTPPAPLDVERLARAWMAWQAADDYRGYDTVDEAASQLAAAYHDIDIR